MTQAELWTPLFSITVFTCLLGIGSIVSYKLGGLISATLFTNVCFIIGFVTEIFPRNAMSQTGLPQIVSAFVTMLLVTHMGTTIDLDQLLGEWKTVLICLAGFVGICATLFTAGQLFFGDYALAAIAPVAGGIVAAQITAEFANAAGKEALGAFAFLVVTFQSFVGMPLAAFFLKKHVRKMMSQGAHLEGAEIQKKQFNINIKFIPEMPKQLNTNWVMIGKLALVAWLANVFSKYVTGGALNAAVAVLLFGIIFQAIGFLDKGVLDKSGALTFMMLCLMSLGPNNFSSLTVESVLGMIIPLVGCLLIGAAGIVIGSIPMALILKVPLLIAFPCGLAAMFGFPSTYIMTTEVIAALNLPDDQRQRITDQVLPQMLVAGFTTVTIASVILAGVISPLLF